MFGLGMGCGQPITTMLLLNRSAERRSGETPGLRQTANNIVRGTPGMRGRARLRGTFCISELCNSDGTFHDSLTHSTIAD